MKTIVLASAAVLAIALSAAALAAPPATSTQKPHSSLINAVEHAAKAKHTSGSVQTYSADTHMLRLKSGEEFKLAPAITGKYTAGEKVTVRWTMKDGAKLADQVKAN